MEPVLMDAPARYLELVNAERWDELESIFTPDAELLAMGIKPRRGLEQIRDYYERAFAPYPQHEDRATRFIRSGRTVVVEIHFDGVTEAGVELSFDAVDVFDLAADGRIERLSSWYDSAWVRESLTRAGGS